MNRRNFFAMIAAVAAAPKAWLTAKPKVYCADGPQALGMGLPYYDEFAQRALPHKCHWELIRHMDASKCLICGDVKSGIRMCLDDDHERHLKAHSLEADLEHNRTCKSRHCSRRSHLLEIITN